jgi:hypothetical protein
MNEEEEEAPLEDPHIRRNRLARERHAAQSEKQHAADANRWATHRAVRSDAQIATDASWRATPLEDPRIRRNRLAWERHATRSKKQHAANANRQVTHKAVRSDGQIAADASWHSDAQLRRMPTDGQLRKLRTTMRKM